MSEQFIKTHVQDHVQIIELDRVDKKNAINNDMYTRLRTMLEDGDANTDVRVILIRGKGNVFTAGNDLGDFNNRPKNGPSKGHLFLRTLHRVKKPLIAQVEGLAIGIGVTLLLHCDLVYAASNARLRLPFVNLGICPEAGSTLLLPQKAGHRAASELFLLGDYFTPEEAKEHGIVNRILPPDDIHDFVWEQAQKLVQQNPQAVMETKRLMKAHLQDATTDQIEAEAITFNRLLQSDASKTARKETLK